MATGLIPTNALKKFHTYYDVVDTGYNTPCWLWNRALNERGYAQFWFKDYGKSPCKNHRAHRAAYKHFIGDVDDTLELDHLCQVEACVNPYHLEPVTDQVNQARKWEVIRSLKLSVTFSITHKERR